MGERLRIVQFINSFRVGGGEQQFVELVKGLRERHDARVASIEDGGVHAASLGQLGIASELFPLPGSLVRPGAWTQVRRLARWLRSSDAQLVHAHDFYSAVMAVPAARLAGCRVVVGRLDLVHWHGHARHLLLAAATRAADCTVVNADAIRRFLVREERLPDARICLIRNGLDVDAFDGRLATPPVAPLPPAQGPIAILVANMHYEVKRQEDFLQALALARAQTPGLTGWLVGDGARRPMLEQLARDLGVADAVHFLGPRRDVPALLARAHVGVLCSRLEGLSNAIVEGLAARLPMVVTDTGGNPELVEHGRRGLVVPVQAPSELANALVWLVRHPQRARQMGEAGRAWVERELSLRNMVEAHEALYRSLLGAYAGTPAASVEGLSLSTAR